MKSPKILLLVIYSLLLTILACNVPTSTSTLIPTNEITSTQPIEIINTSSATSTPQPPTATFTPIAIQQLGTNQAINFTVPLPLSPPHADLNTISGVVYNGYGPIVNASVAISKTYCGDTFQQVKTDNQGYYVLKNIEAGKYYLQVQLSNIIGLCGEEITKNSVGLVKDFVRPRDGLAMISPTDKQTITEIRPTIEWKAVANASFYVIELTYQTSGEPHWGDSWTGKYLATWLTNQTTFVIPFDLNIKTDYKLNIIAYTAERLPLVWAFEIRFQY